MRAAGSYSFPAQPWSTVYNPAIVAPPSPPFILSPPLCASHCVRLLISFDRYRNMIPRYSSEALRDVLEAQKKLTKLQQEATRSDARPAAQAQGRRAPAAAFDRRENSSASSGSPVSATSELAKATERMKTYESKRNSAEKGRVFSLSEDDARRPRRGVVDKIGPMGSAITVQDLSKALPTASTAKIPIPSGHKSRRSLDAIVEGVESDSKAAAVPRGAALPTRQAGSSLPPPYKDISSARSAGVSKVDDSSSTSSRASDLSALNKIPRERSVSDAAAKGREEPVITWSAGASTRKPAHAVPASDVRRSGLSKQAPAVSISGGEFLQRTPSGRSVNETPQQRPVPAPTPASAWRKLSPEAAEKLFRVMKTSIAEEEETDYFTDYPESSYPPRSAQGLAPRRSSFDAGVIPSQRPIANLSQLSASHHRNASGEFRPSRAPTAIPVPAPPLARLVSEPLPIPTARPRPPAFVRALNRRPKKTLSQASTEVWTGDTDFEASATESARSSVYSTVAPIRDPRIGVHIWRDNDEEQLRTIGKRRKPGVQFDFPEEKLPEHTKLTESMVEQLPNEVRSNNER